MIFLLQTGKSERPPNAFVLSLSMWLLLSMIPLGACAQHIVKSLKPIELDGKVLPAEWHHIDTLSFVSHWPVHDSKPNARTEYRITYDEKYLYFSAICYDEPILIQDPHFERDKLSMTSDHVILFLDTYNDNENGLAFAVTPTGSRVDISMSNDAQGMQPADFSWNSFWEANVFLFDSGWSVEGRIPFSSLRFQSMDENVTMGLIAYRYVARERQLDIYPDIPPNWGFWSFLKPSKAMDVTFEKVRNKRPWFTSPYLLSSLGHHHTTEAGSTDLVKETDRKIEPGLDVQHALTDNMNMDISVNTDFAQVEADDQVVNISRFSLFFPEKRRFFLERSSILDFGFDKNNRLFYSRRIGINDGQIIPLWGGVRLMGRVGAYDVGLLNMQSREKFGFPSENFGVLRLRRKVSKNNSYIGGLLTSRTDLRGNTNLAYGVDGIIKLFKNDYLKVNVAQTYQSSDTVRYIHLLDDRKRIYVLWENRAQIGFNYALSYSQVDKNYSPGLGFEERSNYKAFGDRLSYGWFPANKKSRLRYLKFDLNATAYYPDTNNQLESFLLAPSFLIEWVKSNSLQITFNRFYDDTPSVFSLSDDININPGRYVNRDVTLEYYTPRVKFLNAVIRTTTGSFYNGKRFSGSITPLYTISKFLTLSGFYQYNHISFEGSPEYISHIARLKVSASFNVKLSVNAFAQMNSLTKISAINFRLRYAWKDGNDLFLVYNETLTDNGKADEYSLFSNYRAIILKYIYTLHVGR
jgi:hypothetical protein